MDRANHTPAGILLTKVHRLEAGIKAIVHDGGEPSLIIRKGNNDLETGIPVSKVLILQVLHTGLDDLWRQLEALGVERSPPTDLVVARALANRTNLTKDEKETLDGLQV